MSREVPERLKSVKMSGNRTHAEMEILREKQVNGETGKIPANKANAINDEHFRKEYGRYMINDYDANVYHVAMEARLFNHQTGAKISRSKVQTFEPATFRQLIANNGFHGHITFILHDPTLKQTEAGETKGVDTTGKVLPNEGTPVGGQGNVNADKDNVNPLRDGVGTRDSDKGNAGAGGESDDQGGDGSLGNTNTGSGVGNGPGPIDPNTVDATDMNDADAKALYMDLTGKSADGRWSLEKLKEKIAEVQGK
jgi:hypothetical protein